MAGSSRAEDKLAMIGELERVASLGDDQIRLLRQGLAAASGTVICATARVIGKRVMVDMMPDLVRVFKELLGKPAKADKGCLAKVAILEALHVLDCHDEELFLRGVRYTQWEPTFGKPIDTAGRVRAECAIGLARMSHPRAAHEILPLLVDGEPEARAAGVRALAYLGGDAGELLLRMKALVGDEHPAVVGECLSSLMKMDPRGAMEFVAQFLASENMAIVEEAAMALASTQDSQAAKILCQCRTSRVDPTFRERMLVPIAMTRCQEALDALYAIIADESQDSALAAVKAAAIQRHDPHWRGRIQAAVQLREDAAVQRCFEDEFAV